ncbi:hypothetical protein [Streptomyces sp. SAJ15]|uniref:hypothetical protein n=1 Tax=Streptomyces sp. SAJ15 TaxID=2011095 RepID=UPI0016432401|nr:hypothetical protein [Streptomyces sp. SAJ15]
MNAHERRTDRVRRLLDAPPHPVTPPWLATVAAARGHRILRRRRAVRAVGWWLLWLAVVAFAVWASLTEPWHVAPAETTPPLEGW